MTWYISEDKVRTKIKYAIKTVDKNIVSFYYYNPDCNAHMYIRSTDVASLSYLEQLESLFHFPGRSFNMWN